MVNNNSSIHFFLFQKVNLMPQVGLWFGELLWNTFNTTPFKTCLYLHQLYLAQMPLLNSWGFSDLRLHKCLQYLVPYWERWYRQFTPGSNKTENKNKWQQQQKPCMFICLFLNCKHIKTKTLKQTIQTNHSDAYLVMQYHKAKIRNLLFSVYMDLHLDHWKVQDDIKEERKVSSSLSFVYISESAYK